MEKRVAWITGGVKGLGAYIAKSLAEEGYRVVVNYRRSAEAADRLREGLTRQGYEILALQGDAGKVGDVQGITKEILDRWGRLDVLICAAGPFLFRRILAKETTDQQWEEMLEGNLSSVFYCTREAIPIMRQQGFGRIITFGFSGVEDTPAWLGYSAYAAAKSGVATYTRTLALKKLLMELQLIWLYQEIYVIHIKRAALQKREGLLISGTRLAGQVLVRILPGLSAF